MSSQLVFLHFNDVYHTSKRDLLARFLTHLEGLRTRHAASDPYTVFSGDIFSPSLEASILRGAHMLPLLKLLRIDVACYGNHDFDFGEARLRELAADTDFPWLLSNAVRDGTRPGDPDAERLLAGARGFHVVHLRGFKVGFFGLAGTDWPSNCRELPACTIESPVEVARERARFLRLELGCDFVIALTHMRLVEDVEVSEALGAAAGEEERVDLLLGGHDHDLCRRYAGESSRAGVDSAVVDCSFPEGQDCSVDGVVPEASGNVRIVKSGTDWINISCVRLNVSRTSEGIAKLDSVAVEQVSDLRKVSLDGSALEKNQERIVSRLSGVDVQINEHGRDPLVHTLVPLEGIGKIVRSQESNLCNMLADMVRAYYDVDIAFVNAGAVRCDKIIPATKGPDINSNHALTVRDMIDILPFNNEQVVKRIDSNVLLDALENSVSDAHTDGRFLQMSGLSIVADWGQPEGNRILEAWFHHPNAQTGNKERVRRGTKRPGFTIAMVGFIADGFDGYACFKDQETIISAEGGVTDTQLLLQVLGYGSTLESPGAEDDNEREKERIVRARRAILVEHPEEPLPVIAPKLEKRIVFRSQS